MCHAKLCKATPKNASRAGALHQCVVGLCQVLKLLLKGGNLSSELLPVLHQLCPSLLGLLQLSAGQLTLTCQALSAC